MQAGKDNAQDAIRTALASAPWLHGSASDQRELAAAGRKAAATAAFVQAQQLVPRVGAPSEAVQGEEAAAASAQLAVLERPADATVQGHRHADGQPTRGT